MIDIRNRNIRFKNLYQNISINTNTSISFLNGIPVTMNENYGNSNAIIIIDSNASTIVSIKFTKKGVDGVNMYSRNKGDSNWVKIAFVNYSSYTDKRPLSVAGTAEVRQYMAIGVLKDVEIGQMSDIVEVVFGG